MSSCSKPKKSDAGGDSSCQNDPVASPTSTCDKHEDDIVLVELVEVTHDGKKWVKGAAGETTKIADSVKRISKDGSDYKQYINLESKYKKDPKYGRIVKFKARVEWKSDASKKDGLGGHTVYFTYDFKGSDGRPAAMHKDEKEGFVGSSNGIVQAITKHDGWTPSVKFQLSQFAGDKHQIIAGLKEESSPDNKKTKYYKTWRKFWYQLTLFKGKSKPDLSTAKTGYKDVFAYKMKSSKEKVEFTKDELKNKKAGIEKVTIYPKYACVPGDSTETDTSVIGSHNEKVIRTFFKKTKKEPVKMHYMMCDCQWDPGGDTGAMSTVIAHGASSKVVSVADVIIKPALKGNLIISGKWYAYAADDTYNGTSGNMSEDYIVIQKPRTKLGQFKVVVPAGVVSKSTGGGIKLFYKLAKAKEYLGDSDGYQITVVMGRAGTPKTCNHEAGHAFQQAPNYGGNAANLPKSFDATEKATLKVYKDSGWHCSHGATAKGTIFQSGDCVLATRSNKTNCEYCELCKPFMKLQDMSPAKVGTPKR